MARPPKNGKDKMTVFLPKTRITEAQNQELKQLATDARITQADYIRRKLFGGSISKRVADPLRAATISFLNNASYLASELRVKNQLGDKADQLIINLDISLRHIIKHLDGNTGQSKGKPDTTG